MGRNLLSFRCNPEQQSPLLWFPAMCNQSCIIQELALACTSRLSCEESIPKEAPLSLSGLGNKRPGIELQRSFVCLVRGYTPPPCGL